MASSSNLSEEKVKDYIRSILTSTPNVSTIYTLTRDYKDLIGEGIPFYSFKYNSLEHFLKSIPDVCKVRGTGQTLQIYPVISEKIEHINNMVTRQKNLSKGKRSFSNPKRYNTGPAKPIASARKFNCLYSSTNATSSGGAVECSNKSSNKFSKNGQYTSQSCKMENLNNSNDGQVQKRLGSMQLKETHNRLLEEKRMADNVNKSLKTNVQNWVNSTSNEIPDNTPLKEGQNNLSEVCQESKTDNNDELFNKSKDLLSFDQVKEKNEEDFSNVPKRVQNNLKTLISQFEDGIWVAELPSHYKRLFKKELSFMDYGYANLIDMCLALKHIWHYVRPDVDDFKLYDRSKPLPPTAEKIYTIASYDIGEKVPLDKALPDLEWSDLRGLIPDDVFEYGNEIPNQFLPEGTKVESIFDVVVVEIYDPSKFWLYFGNSHVPAIIDDLMDNLQNFYNDSRNAKKYTVPMAAIKEGLYCVQVIYGEYHRARIVTVFPDSNEYVRVLYIDYGTVCKASIKGMCFLTKEFGSVPAQAIRCRLANIVPKLKGHPWNREASERFRALVNQRDTKIKISYIDWASESMYVFLADVTDHNNPVYINELLVNEHHALWDGEVIGGNCYDVERAKMILIDWKLLNRRKMAALNKSI